MQTPREMYNKYSDTSLERIFIKICTDRTTHLAARKNMDNRVACFQRNINDFLSYENGTDLVNKNTGRGKFSKKNSAQMQLDTSLSQVSKGSYSTFWMLFILVRRNVQMFLNSKLTGLMLFSPIFCTLLMCITFKVSKVNVSDCVCRLAERHCNVCRLIGLSFLMCFSCIVVVECVSGE